MKITCLRRPKRGRPHVHADALTAAVHGRTLVYGVVVGHAALAEHLRVVAVDADGVAAAQTLTLVGLAIQATLHSGRVAGDANHTRFTHLTH